MTTDQEPFQQISPELFQKAINLLDDEGISLSVQRHLLDHKTPGVVILTMPYEYTDDCVVTVKLTRETCYALAAALCAMGDQTIVVIKENL